MDINRQINVLITGLGGGGHGMEILKSLKLSDLPYFFVGTDITKASYGLSLADKSYIVPVASHPSYIDTLIDIIRRNNIQVLFHGSEPELKAISENRDIFKAEGVLIPINSKTIIDLCMNKFEMIQLLKSKGIKVPATFLISSIKDINQIATYPLVCKPHIGSGGSNNVFLIQDSREFYLLTEYLLNYLNSFIVQEYIGDANSEYTVGVLTDFEGNLIDSIAVKRQLNSALSTRIRLPNKTANLDLGDTLIISSGISQGEIGRFKEVTEFCEMISTTVLFSKGPLNLQCRLYKGDVFIFEINPRFSGTTHLRALAGFNEPDILIRRYILQQSIGTNRICYKKGIILRSLSEKFLEM